MASSFRPWMLSLVCFATFVGCRREPVAVEVPQAAPVMMAFDGRTWERVGPCSPERMARPGMVAVEYKTTEPDVRLVEMTLDPKALAVERVNVRIRRVQVLRDGRWIDDGLKVCDYRDGSRMETRMTLGVFGEQKEWDPSGEQLVFRGCADQFFDGEAFTE